MDMKLSIRQRTARIASLIVISPLIAEVLFGSTRLSMLYLLVPQICIYGGAALIIHTLTRHRDKSIILTLGIAFAIAEECVILQTSVSPPFQHFLFGGAPNQSYLGLLGINWAYLLWALGYESIWAIVLPIQLTGLIFRDQIETPWIGRNGLVIAGIVFLIPSYGIWYTFTQMGIAPGLAYETPLPLILAALGAIVLLGIIALVLLPPSHVERKKELSVPEPRLVGLTAFLLGLPWFSLAILPYLLPLTVTAEVPITIGLGWAALAYYLIRYWSASRAWGDTHRLALCFGALLASMLAGFVINGSVLSPFDLIGKIVFNMIAVVLLIILARRVSQRDTIEQT